MKKYTILSVDDEKLNQRLVLAVLKDEPNCHILTAYDGKQAVEIAQQNEVNLVLMDINLPEMDGFATVKQLKTIPRMQDVPVIFITAREHEADMVAAFDLGAVDFIRKPFNTQELKMRVRSHLALYTAHDQRQLAINQLHEVIASRDALYSIMAHDLKNPLSSLLSTIDYVYEEFYQLDNTEMHQYIEYMEESAQRMSLLLENLLAWARGQRQGQHLNLEDVDLAKLVQEVIGLFKLGARNKQIELHANLNDKLLVYTNWQMLATIVRNLVSNAIKFTSAKGFVTLTAQLKDEHILLRVSDTGVGMDADTLAKVLHGGGLSTLGTNQEKGTGLGLNLCHKLANRIGASITATSHPGDGTTFTIHIPVKQ